MIGFIYLFFQFFCAMNTYHINKESGGETHNTTHKDMSSMYHQEQTVQPCQLSSSIHYGG